ncbi:subtilisin-like serine protease [Formosa agariphila KMM 3901]|uniref:Subtilisin-like serine protease n=1 Tax=Formosa agariphila (strain DSM 15362 / KCTC 12365 / LMG 23005 / KMM 3901 / M-2Alg 35-1) TaxID=1347342 RepID=T2KJC7_FORAG|nr:S8 family serine peptidase [Formosa agariphila]CDF78538.1 subtilisin-like serine protease [Formosa agariphila KMM 3901]
MASKLLFLLFICVQLQVYGQQDAWVYFSDKENVETSLANPITILSQKAIDRKQRHGVIIDARDVPVNATYITALKAQENILVLAKSKWFNAVHVRGSEVAITALLNFPFVSEISFADKTLAATNKSQNEETFSEVASVSEFVYGNTLNQVEMIHVNTLHENDYTGVGITIAVLDSGFPNVNTIGAFQNLRNNNNLLGSYDFVERDNDVYADTQDEHGTWVLSTMAGYIENEFVGTAPDASYYLFRTEDGASENPVEESLWVEAAERADSLGVDIINTSLGYKTYDNPNYNHTDADLDGLTTFITKGASIASEKGILVVSSSGNSGASGVGAPADSEAVFSVGAVNASGAYAYFSSQGSDIQPSIKPDVTAQGLGSVVVSKTNTIQTLNGTSFSSPIIAGGLACLWQALPNLTHTELKQLVRESSSQYTTPDYLLGYGIPNLATALGALGIENQAQELELLMYPNPTTNKVYFKKDASYTELHVVVFNVLGTQILERTLKQQEALDVSTFSEGVYVLQISALDKITTKKLIKINAK